jgi:hypothetical protein
MIHPDLHAALRPFLLPGERPLWAGRPKQGLLLRAADLYLVPFSLFFLGFAIVWNQGLWSDFGAAFPFDLIGAVLLLSGAYAALGRFLVDAVLRSKTLYAVTDRRILIHRGGPWRSLRALELNHLPMLELRQQAGGRGTINFDAPPDPSWWSNGHKPEWTPLLSNVPRFLAIDGAAAVYDLISREAERLRRERLASLPPGQANLIG